MSQLDMLLTQFGFMGFTLLSPEAIGAAPATSEDIEGFLHFWRTIGHFLGIEDRSERRQHYVFLVVIQFNVTMMFLNAFV
jgi:hypothetical protein